MSLDYTVEAFHPLEFLASPFFAETACLVADINMPRNDRTRAPDAWSGRARDSDDSRD
jgi:hypothetical protein